MSNAFVTMYLTRPKMDRHPHKDWPVNFDQLHRLAASIEGYGELVVCADELTMDDVPPGFRRFVSIHRVIGSVENVYLERWDIVRDLLTKRTDLDLVCVCDARDVIVVGDPWQIEPGQLYTCSEPETLRVGRRGRQIWYGQPLGRSGFINDPAFHANPMISQWIAANQDLTALNAGVAVADRATMHEFATLMAEWRLDDSMKGDYTDMALFNFVAHRDFTVVASEDYIGAKCHTEAEAPNARILHVT